MIKRISCICLLFIWICANVVFAHQATIQNAGNNQYKSVRLTPEVYSMSNSNLSDLRINDETGEVVPYFIHSGYQNISSSQEQYPLKLVDAYTKEDKFYFDYTLTKTYVQDVVATSIRLSGTVQNFAKQIKVYGSYDGVSWTFVQEDTLYRVDSNEKLEIVFVKPQKFTHYRFELSNNLEKITFDSAELSYNTTTYERKYFEESIKPKFAVEEKEKETYIHIEGLKNLKLSEISIDTDSIFKRNVRTPFRSKLLYHLMFQNQTYSDTVIPMEHFISKEDIFTVVIENKDDKPIAVNSIDVKYDADELVFDGSNGKIFTLTFAADETVIKPQYDIVNYKQEVLKQEIDRLELSDITFDKVSTPKQPKDYTVWFNVTIVVIAIFLGAIILMKLRRNEN